ncbi:hypothetical protein [Dokdonella sp.]|uniref:hypothetical protein n=1 Tax=Dokdonella sp. TaxID=2291710 RepID=UPI003527275E
MASAFHPNLAPVGVLMAVLGYATRHLLRLHDGPDVAGDGRPDITRNGSLRATLNKWRNRPRRLSACRSRRADADGPAISATAPALRSTGMCECRERRMRWSDLYLLHPCSRFKAAQQGAAC